MVREHYTATVREDSKGQKEITIPKNADLHQGDTVKLKKTKKWGYQECIDAIEAGQKEAAQKWYKDDDLAPEKIGFTTFKCMVGEGREPCMWTELREIDMLQHLKEDHDIEEIGEGHYHEEWNIGTVDLARMLPFIIRKLDTENKELHADEVVENIEQVVTSDKYDHAVMVEKLHDYAHKLKQEYMEEE